MHQNIGLKIKYSLIVVITLMLSSNWLIAQELSWKFLSAPQGLVRSFESVGDDLYAGYQNKGVMRSRDAGLTWDTLNNGLEDYLVYDILAKNTEELFVATLIGSVFYSANKGENWVPFNSGINAVYTYCLLLKGDNLYAGTSLGIYTASAKEGKWTRLTLPKTTAVNQDIYCLHLSGNSIFAGSSQSAYRSDDDGKTWIEIPKITRYVLTSFAEKDGTLYIGTSGDGLMEMDLKTNVVKPSDEFIGSPEPSSVITALLVAPNGILYKASNRLGVFQRDSTLNRGLPILSIRTLGAHKNLLLAGVELNGIAALNGLLTSVEEVNTLNHKVNLQINPNPVAEQAQITLQLRTENPQLLKIELITTSGQVMDGSVASYSPGEHSIPLKVHNLPAGLYYCRVSNSSGSIYLIKPLAKGF